MPALERRQGAGWWKAGGVGGGYKRRTVEGASQSGKRGRDITTKGSAGKHWFWGNIISFETEHYCIFKISAPGNGATFFSFLSPPPLQCPGQVLYYQPDQRYVYLYLYCDNWRPSIDDCRYMLVMQDSLNYCPVGVLRYPIWFKSMFEFCQKIIHSIFDSILL